MKLYSQQGKKIGIFGLSVTGISVYKALVDIDVKLICFDDSKTNIDQFIKSYDREIITDICNEEWQNLDKIVVSPGISHNHKIFTIARKYDIPISSDIELLYEENPNAKYIVITGTNGKSTTAALTHHILTANGIDYKIGGNIGMPVLSLEKSNGYILELSSFQIELLKNFSPKIALILNITPDHLDRYQNFMEYQDAKFKILEGAAIIMLGMDNEITRKKYEHLISIEHRNILSFSCNEKSDIRCCDDYLYDNYFDNEKYQIPKHKYLKGVHNQENIAASIAICRMIGVRTKDIINTISSFKGLQHRMQYVKTIKNIHFYNDSKATNSAATIHALHSFNNIFWLAGGIYKEENLSMFNEKNLVNVKKAYFFGQSKDLFIKYFDRKIDYQECDTLEEAFYKAYQDAGDNNDKMCNILMSPACASYDQFKNFTHRGDEFIKLIEGI